MSLWTDYTCAYVGACVVAPAQIWKRGTRRVLAKTMKSAGFPKLHSLLGVIAIVRLGAC
jgi:hypothetical protein